ncbi:MAG: hypothetical protein K2K39_00885 [Clostridia bacterium]|nr:hypothetical protein [Clostridia bacterium]
MAAKKFKNKNGIFAAVGAATGLGNAFRFPALCVKYGAAFILVYALVLVVVCFPLLCAELSFGTKKLSGRGAKIWAVIMRAAAANSALIALYYGVIAAKIGSASLSFALFPDAESGGVYLFVFALIFVLVAAYALLKGGAKALSLSGKVSVILSLALFSSLSIAGLIRGGAFSSFNAAAIKGGAIWADALGQSLLALSLAAGVMPSYAKTLPKPFSVPFSALKIVVANFIMCVLTTLSILPFYSFLSATVGVTCALNAYSQVIFSLFKSAAAVRIFGAALFGVLTVVAVHSLASLAYPAVSRLSFNFRLAPLVFCVLAACLAPLFTLGDMRVLSACDKIACSVNAVALAVAESLFFALTAAYKGGNRRFKRHLSTENHSFAEVGTASRKQ